MSLRTLSNAVVMCVALGCAAHAQQVTPDIAGQWQGTLKTPGGQLRLILQIARDGAGWKAETYSIDQTTDALPVTSISLDAGTLKFAIAPIRVTYEGNLSDDGNSVTGTFTQVAPLPLEFTRATPATAWAIDPAKHSVQFVAVDVDKDAGADVKLEVLDWAAMAPTGLATTSSP